MIAKFFCRKTEAMVLIWNPPPQSQVSLLKRSSLSWIERGTNWEGRLIQERGQWELGQEGFGVGRVKPPWGWAQPAPAGQGRGAGSPPGLPSLCPPRQTPRGGCAWGRGAFGGSEISPQKRGVRAHLLQQVWLCIYRHWVCTSRGNIFDISTPTCPSTSFFCQEKLDLKVPFQPGVLGWAFPVGLFTQFFSLILKIEVTNPTPHPGPHNPKISAFQGVISV